MMQARLPAWPVLWGRTARKVLASPVFWAAALQAVGAVVVAVIDRL